MPAARGRGRGKARVLVRGAVVVASVGLALHLVLPQIAGIERSGGLVVAASPPLVLAAFLAEVASVICYAELLGRAVGAAAGSGPSPRARRRRGLGAWFALRLTVTGYGVARVLPGGGAAASAVDYEALRARGLSLDRITLALALIAALTYAVLGLLFAGNGRHRDRTGLDGRRLVRCLPRFPHSQALHD